MDIDVINEGKDRNLQEQHVSENLAFDYMVRRKTHDDDHLNVDRGSTNPALQRGEMSHLNVIHLQEVTFGKEKNDRPPRANDIAIIDVLAPNRQERAAIVACEKASIDDKAEINGRKIESIEQLQHDLKTTDLYVYEPLPAVFTSSTYDTRAGKPGEQRNGGGDSLANKDSRDEISIKSTKTIFDGKWVDEHDIADDNHQDKNPSMHDDKDLRRFKVNDNFFNKIDTPEKAYILGLLASDGNLHKGSNRVRLRLNERDSSILEKIRINMGLEKPIGHYSDRKGGKMVDLSFSSRIIYQDLIKAGINPSTKSLELKYPSKHILEEKFTKDFIRGYFDGDGSISVHKSKGFPEFKMNFTGTYDVLENIARILHEEIGLKQPSIRKDVRTVNNHIFSISGTGNAGKIFIYLYGEKFDISIDLAVERKYNKMKFAHEKFKESIGKRKIIDKEDFRLRIIDLIKEHPRNTSELVKVFNFKHETIKKPISTLNCVEKIYPHDRTGPGHLWSLPGQKLKDHIYPECISKEILNRALKPSQIRTYMKAVKAGYYDLKQQVGNKELSGIWGEKLPNVQKKMKLIKRSLMKEVNRETTE
jgi:hypothetical protein